MGINIDRYTGQKSGNSMREKTCCFTGHRVIPQADYRIIKKRLENEVEKLIHQGVVYFGTGGALGFDTLAAETVIELRKKYPYIKLILVLPCENQTKNWKREDIIKYEQIKGYADKVRVLSGHYYNGCMQVRNRHLVDCSAFCICYLRKSTGGTAYTVNYAVENGLTIIRI